MSDQQFPIAAVIGFLGWALVAIGPIVVFAVATAAPGPVAAASLFAAAPFIAISFGGLILVLAAWICAAVERIADNTDR